MKIISNLTGKLTDGEWREPRGILQTVHVEPKPGVFQLIQLGEGGLTVRRGEIKVGIPLSEILQLAEKHCPELIATPVQKTSKK